ncbi:MAG: hypothetical protein LUG21_08440 [Clostridiales bacterium]|nr:hypothetical protein [Clostridiales bacterium]
MKTIKEMQKMMAQFDELRKDNETIKIQIRDQSINEEQALLKQIDTRGIPEDWYNLNQLVKKADISKYVYPKGNANKIYFKSNSNTATCSCDYIGQYGETSTLHCSACKDNDAYLLKFTHTTSLGRPEEEQDFNKADRNYMKAKVFLLETLLVQYEYIKQQYIIAIEESLNKLKTENNSLHEQLNQY